MAKRNCHACEWAKDKGDRFSCRWKDDKLKEAARQAPFAPVYYVWARKVDIAKDKVPEKNCPAFKERKKP